jgi:hypothetical protein
VTDFGLKFAADTNDAAGAKAFRALDQTIFDRLQQQRQNR